LIHRFYFKTNNPKIEKQINPDKSKTNEGRRKNS